MKTLFKALFLTFLLSACGGGSNRSGGGSSQVTLGGGQFAGISQSVQFSSLQSLRNYYPLNTTNGLAANQYVYHVGSLFGNTSTGSGLFNFNFDFSFCFMSQCHMQELYQVIDNGRLIHIQNDLNLRRAYDVQSGQFVYESFQYTEQSSIYRYMFSYDRTPISTQFSNATITFLNGQTMPATVVNYFYGETWGTEAQITGVRRVIFASGLPLVANPIATFNSSYQLTGALSYFGNNYVVKSIQVDKFYDVQYTSMGVQYVEVQGTTISINQQNPFGQF